jgi:hypothetical protein
MKVLFIIIIAVVFLLLLNNMDDRLLYIENYLRQIKDLLHEIKSKL